MVSIFQFFCPVWTMHATVYNSPYPYMISKWVWSYSIHTPLSLICIRIGCVLACIRSHRRAERLKSPPGYPSDISIGTEAHLFCCWHPFVGIKDVRCCSPCDNTQKTVLLLSSLIESTAGGSVLCKSSIGKDMDSVDVAVTMPDRQQLEGLLQQMDDDEDAGKKSLAYLIISKIVFFLLCRMGRFIWLDFKCI